MAKGKKKRSRCTHPLCHFAQQLQRDRGDAPSFQLRCYQTHGLVTHRSDRNQKGHVHAVRGQEPCRFWRRLLDESSGRCDRAHEGDMTVVDRADARALGELSKPIYRKGQIWIRVHSARVEGPASMTRHKGGCIDVRWNLTEARVAASHGSVEWPLTRQNETRRRDEGNSTLR